jgi:hypothetical protein
MNHILSAVASLPTPTTITTAADGVGGIGGWNEGIGGGVVNIDRVTILVNSPEAPNLATIANQAGGDAAIAWKRIEDAIAAYQYDLEEAKYDMGWNEPSLCINGADDFSFEPLLEALVDAIVLDTIGHLTAVKEPIEY